MNLLLVGILFAASVASPDLQSQPEPAPLLAEGPVIIQGRVANADNPKVLLLNPELTGETEHVAYLDEEGRFEFRIGVLSPHDGSVRVGGARIELFLSPGDLISFEIDLERPDASLIFTGTRAGTNASLNAFISAFGARVAESDFGGRRDELPADEFKAFAREFFGDLESVVATIEETHQPDAEGRAWMRTFLKYKHGEELFEYGVDHADSLPPGYYDLDDELFRVGPFDLQCSQFYDDFVHQYHVGHVLRRHPDFPMIIEQFRSQTEEGVARTFAFIDREIEDELVKRLIVTQMMTDFVASDHVTAARLLDRYTSIVPDRASRNFIERRIDARRALRPLVSGLDDLARSEMLGELFREIRESHGGKVIYMDIWATWCAACVTTFPHSKRLAAELEGSGVQPIYLCTGSQREDWIALSRKHDLPADANYFLTVEQTRELSRILRYNGLPRYVILDRDGMIVDDHAKQPSSLALKDELIEFARD